MQDKAVPVAAAQPAQAAPLRVFLVEDLGSTRELMAELFTAIGRVAVVGTAASEGEAKLWLDEHPGAWDIAVLDLILEAGSGMGVIPHCKRLHPAAKVVVFSGYASPVLHRHCTRLGADAMFHKDETGAFIGWFGQQLAPTAGAEPARGFAA